jgi:predicted nucleic acid-binding protein
VVGKAKVLVSGGKNLLVLSEEFEQASGCVIVTMDTFFNL